jgi:Mg-chelatase subunit ChlD
MLWYNQLCDPSDSDVITFVTALDSRWQETQECDVVTDTDANDDYVLDESNLYTAMTAEAEAATSDISPPPPRLNLLDLVFVIDTTNSMYDDIDAVKARALEILDLIDYGSVDWRVGLVTYRDYPYSPYGDRGDYTSRIDLNFTSNRSDIVAEINRINVGGGGDFPESVYSGLMTAIRFPWRTDAKKVIILMGDAPPHDPEPETGFTRNQVLQAAFDADRKNVYPILISDSSDTRDAFQILADGSSGRMFRAEDASVVVDTLMRTIISITDDRELSSMLASGESATVYTDDGSNLNLRSGPGVGNEIVSKLPSGTNVIILGGPVFGAPYIWWNIQTPSGISGWAVEAAGGGITLIPMLTWDLNLSGGEPIMGYGDVLSGRKSSDATDILVFTGNRGDIVMIDALSDEFYTYLRLFDTNNILLAEDNNRMDTNSSIRYELLADGKYYIVIDGYESSAAGDYNVSLEIEPPIDPMSVPSCPGAPMTRFRAGDIAVVDFNDPEALRIIDDPLASMFTTLAQLYDNNRVELLEGPICSAGKYYWRVYYNRLDVFGWIAEGDSRPYLCRISDPECR